MRKKHIIGSVLMSIFLMSLPVICAEAGVVETAESIIENYVEAMDSGDWEKFVSLHCSEEKQSLESFFDNKENVYNHVGVLNVEGFRNVADI